MRPRWILAAGLVAVLVVIGAVLAPQILATARKPAAPELATVARRSFPAVVVASGTVVPSSQVSLNFAVSGRLSEISVHSGDTVSLNQTIARLDATAQQAKVAQAQAGLNGAQASLLGATRGTSLDTTRATVNTMVAQDAATLAADMQRLSNDQARYAADGCTAPGASGSPICIQDQAAIDDDRRAISNDQARQRLNAATEQNLLAQSAAGQAAQVQQAQAQVAAAQAQLQGAIAELANTTLKAPQAGTILSINGHVGENVAASATASDSAPGSNAPLPTTQGGSTTLGVVSKAFAVMGDGGGLQIAAPFSEVDAVRLKAGQEGAATIDSLPGVKLGARIVAIAREATIVSGVVQYFATLAPDAVDPNLKVGMTANVSVPVARVDGVLAVPKQALYSVDQKMRVDVWYQQRAVSTDVTVGLVGDKLSEIKSGLIEGQQVVLSATHGVPGRNLPPLNGSLFAP